MKIFQNIDKDNLHHAYLIEGLKEEIESEIFDFFRELKIEISNNPDFCHIEVDSFKIEDARNLKSMSLEKGALMNSSTQEGKKIFLISANSFLLEAQNTLLKIFEEPIPNTHFFIVIPDANTLLKTLVSRFYLISTKQNLSEEIKIAEKFITMSLKNRIDFIKELLTEDEEENEEENIIIKTSNARSKALKFLNALEIVMSKAGFDKNMSRGILDTETCFAHIFKVREFINQPGSSIKNLMESVALIMPNF